MKQLLEKLERKENSHKGENGKVLVIGGSTKYTGAPALAAKAALRTGADLVKILTSKEAKPVVQSYSENLIVESYGEKFDQDSLERALELEKWADTTLIGPGLADFDVETLEKFANQASTLIIDAGAIEHLLNTSGNIFTPHSGEAEIMGGVSDSVKMFAYETDNVVLLKGEKDRIFSGKEVYENDTGHPTMTVGGTGDVLAGIVSSLSAQGLSGEESARLGAWINGKTGELAAEYLGNGALATDMIEKIPETMN